MQITFDTNHMLPEDYIVLRALCDAYYQTPHNPEYSIYVRELLDKYRSNAIKVAHDEKLSV